MSMLRGKFTKNGEMKYISHLDLVSLFHRVLRRAGIDIAYSQGFNPHPIISFATALSLGVESTGEYFDLKLNEEMPIGEFKEKVNEHMPRGIQIIEAIYINDKEDSLMSMVEYSDYRITLGFSQQGINQEQLNEEIRDFLDQESIMITRKKKKKRRQRRQEYKEVDVKPLIHHFTVEKTQGKMAELKVLLTTGSKGNLKPEDLIKLFDQYLQKDHSKFENRHSIESDLIKIQRIDLYQEVGGELKDLIDAVKQ